MIHLKVSTAFQVCSLIERFILFDRLIDPKYLENHPKSFDQLLQEEIVGSIHNSPLKIFLEALPILRKKVRNIGITTL